MAIVVSNPLTKAFSGALGGLVFRQLPNGSVVVSLAPKFHRRKFSKGQKEHQQRFREASDYARGAARVHPIYAERAKETMKTAYNIALSDWFNPPVVHQVQQRDGCILVEATDNVLVTKVQVTILDEEGKSLETVEGVKRDGNWWEVPCNVQGNMIVAEAWDLAGNVTRYEFVKASESAEKQ